MFIAYSHPYSYKYMFNVVENGSYYGHTKRRRSMYVGGTEGYF